MVFGTRVFKYWALGPARLKGSKYQREKVSSQNQNYIRNVETLHAPYLGTLDHLGFKYSQCHGPRIPKYGCSSIYSWTSKECTKPHVVDVCPLWYVFLGYASFFISIVGLLCTRELAKDLAANSKSPKLL